MNITEFLLARIAEDHERIDMIPDWQCTDSARGEGWGSRGDCPLCGHHMFDGDEATTEEAYWDHMETVHCRLRVLAECKAKRELVRMARRVLFPSQNRQGAMWDGQRDFARATLMALASVYSDHPDYDEAWRVA